MRHRRPSAPKVPTRPETAEAGASLIQRHALKLFARDDGAAVDWSLLAESLFRVAFHCLDHSTDPARRLSMLRRLEAGTYDRLAGNDQLNAVQNAPEEPAASLGHSPDPVPPAPATGF